MYLNSGISKIYRFAGIVLLRRIAQFYKKEFDMLTREIRAEIKWMVLAIAIAILLGSTLYNSFESNLPGFRFDVSLIFESIVFLVFSTFVVFGIKGYFEKYSQKFANVIIFSCGVILTVVIFILSYQILFPG